LIVAEVIDRIEFNISTKDDLSGKSANNLFTKRNIVRALKTALDDYAQYTLEIEGIKSYSISEDQRILDAPSDRVRSQTYRGMYVVLSSVIYPLNVKDFNMVKSTYYYNEIKGVPTDAFMWQNKINIYPRMNTSYISTTLEADCDKNATTLTIDHDGSDFQPRNGRVQVEDEVIEYEKITNNSAIKSTLSGCTRGLEGTAAADHSAGSTVKQKNFYIYYYKIHWDIPLLDNNTIAPAYLTKEMEINDVHLEPIISEASYKLLAKIDINRANFYKQDYKLWLRRAKYEVMQGRNNTKVHGKIRDPYPFEIGFVRDY